MPKLHAAHSRLDSETGQVHICARTGSISGRSSAALRFSDDASAARLGAPAPCFRAPYRAAPGFVVAASAL
eukprot:16440987-Heterocapsa_arctica.AAC.1